MNIFFPIILVGMLIVIVCMLIICDRLIGNGGQKEITINEETKISVKSNEILVNALSQQKVFIPSACGGKATCGFCKFRLIEGGGKFKPTEEPFLSDEEKKNGTRLACQVKVRENLKIEIPNEFLNAQEFKTIVEEMKDLTIDTKLVRLKLIKPEIIHFKPGQYAELKVPGIDAIRAYSIASNPKEANHVEFIIHMQPKDKTTGFVHKALRVGDKITVTGPFGHFYLHEESNKEMICIAGGPGKAPIRSILYYLKDRGMQRKVKYFYGAKSKADLYYTEEFEQLAEEYPNFEYIPALSEPLPADDWDGEVGQITNVVDRLTDDLTDAEAYLCGSPGMINACINVLSKHKIHDENVFYDRFS